MSWNFRVCLLLSGENMDRERDIEDERLNLSKRRRRKSKGGKREKKKGGKVTLIFLSSKF